MRSKSETTTNGPLFVLAALLLGSVALIAVAQGPATPPNRVIDNKDHAEMILIPDGPFVYGMSQQEIKKLLRKYKFGWAEIYGFEVPKQQGRVAAFYIDRYEVTNSEYAQFLKETGHREPKYWRRQLLNGLRQPVVGVGWKDAEAYGKWAGKRLPTEEEWEKAARGTDGRAWPWGNTPTNAAYNGRAQARGAPVDVGSSPSGDSPYGVSDMAGNVWLCREIVANIEHGLTEKAGEWRVSITGSRATENWDMRIQGPNGFERSYTLSGAAGEDEPEAIRKIILQLVSN